jgi:hypothetical protein
VARFSCGRAYRVLGFIHSLGPGSLMVVELPSYSRDEWIELRLHEFLTTRITPASEKMNQKYRRRIGKKYDAAMTLLSQNGTVNHRRVDNMFMLLSRAYMYSSDEEFQNHIKRALEDS